MRPHLLSWQYQGYPEYHRNRMNLLIHIVAVPAFVASAIWLVSSALSLHWFQIPLSLLALVVSFLVQGFGHQREAMPSVPFAGTGDAVSRILAEQFITFPRFVSSGGFARALKGSSASR